MKSQDQYASARKTLYLLQKGERVSRDDLINYYEVIAIEYKNDGNGIAALAEQTAKLLREGES